MTNNFCYQCDKLIDNCICKDKEKKAKKEWEVMKPYE